MNALDYLNGFGNHHQSAVEPGILIPGRNSPQTLKHNLFAEQISGSAFTAPRHANLHSWLYRTQPSVLHSEFELTAHAAFIQSPFNQVPTPPTQMRWDPLPITEGDFIQGIFSLAGNSGGAIHLYSATQSMTDTFFYNADGELLILPQEGGLRCKTELGILDVKPGEIAVIPRGIKFQVLLHNPTARGYLCENFGAPFQLPELGFIGANGLANPRDFQIPVAAVEQAKGHFNLLAKFQGNLWSASINHSPFNVMAWQGNYFPYKYDLSLFNTINTVSFDHPDPSIFTVLTSPSNRAGVANLDFVIFPPRWMVADDTFRPPYFHRNIMNEYMGLLIGTYDAKENGFLPGGGSLHNCMSPHGPDAQAFLKATQAELKPEYYANTLAFMFESNQVWRLTAKALAAEFRQKNYLACWQGLEKVF